MLRGVALGDGLIRDIDDLAGAPGAYWEYNDVRVNRLSLSLLKVFRKPLDDEKSNEFMALVMESLL